MDTPLEGREYAQMEQALFIDLIRSAPSGADLVITPDSWDGLPALFGERLTTVVAGNSEEWVVALTPQNRNFLVAQALEDEVYGKFVHFYIVAAGKEIVSSYDHMACLILDPNFPDYRRIVAEYAPLGDIIG
ncbi:hypothetical protein [Hymenobacter koreensis]|uniref:Uncharacterized protein n=1 Tax=Hymenobacter koreensis TaxID=1084523 RepID=A0ABP8IY74_9BACT